MGTSTQTNSPLIKEKTLAQQINSEDPSPVKTLNLYKRIWPGKKCLFAPSGGEPAQYFIKNPVPHKHASQWKPVFYRGDNPKYDPDSIAVSRGFRTGFWNSFRFEHGDGVDMVLKNKRRVSARKWHRRKTKMRGWFGKPEKPPKKPLEDEEEVEGLVMEFRMHRPRFITRALSFELNGEKYRWSGTRRFLPNWAKRFKGISHDFKLVNSKNQLVATFEKDRWAIFKPSEKWPETANKRKHYIGTLTMYPVDHVEFNSPGEESVNEKTSPEVTSDNNGEKLKKKTKRPNKNLNPGGHHAGNITEEAIVFTCWAVVEAEHRLRHKLEDLAEEIGEIVGG
ncbi:unnamed protein product [Clonostachys rosea f. rosea IK726]|uniref:Uncharacterized protein n=3 Tax=Clonostachys rosea f. rosea IK726 TaxID=1349383 RepID=A0ACA9ULI2_BIOOC|nr:unnamed protein product [Clonostachys rosea f. rosea IK726]CAG9954280.1 unnamed protein product [Clonostachys rosea f. rosea IK726]CAG9954284.1 unnamed protein product [Clonostachys rosea f. rosea IK726]